MLVDIGSSRSSVMRGSKRTSAEVLYCPYVWQTVCVCVCVCVGVCVYVRERGICNGRRERDYNS